jgi:hypothetical protein
MIPIIWSTPTSIRNIEDLRDRVERHGGAIVQYERVVSVIVYSRMESRFEWVPPDTSHRAAGLKHAGACALLGWWSIPGFFWTSGAIINNLLGGLDVTDVLLRRGDDREDSVALDRALRDLRSAERRSQIVLVAWLLIVLGLIVVLLFP